MVLYLTTPNAFLAVKAMLALPENAAKRNL